MSGHSSVLYVCILAHVNILNVLVLVSHSLQCLWIEGEEREVEGRGWDGLIHSV